MTPRGAIGTRSPGKRSPSFYGLAAQELETELGGVVGFLEGASGSTHNLGDVRKLEGAAGEYRLRVGDWRVLFTFEDSGQTLLVSRVLNRRDAYR